MTKQTTSQYNGKEHIRVPAQLHNKVNTGQQRNAIERERSTIALQHSSIIREMHNSTHAQLHYKEVYKVEEAKEASKTGYSSGKMTEQKQRQPQQHVDKASEAKEASETKYLSGKMTEQTKLQHNRKEQLIIQAEEEIHRNYEGKSNEKSNNNKHGDYGQNRPYDGNIPEIAFCQIMKIRGNEGESYNDTGGGSELTIRLQILLL